ncbi:MAG: hypothetical protein ACTS8Y_03220, partial [Arsenophonus sp. ER-EMS1-MAG3]
DYPDRDDINWLCHTIYLPQSGTMTRREVNMQPKLCNSFKPKPRTY